MSRWLRTVSAPSVTCTATRAIRSDAGPVSSRRSRRRVQTPHQGREDAEHDDERADTMGKMNRDLRIPVRRQQMTEHQRKVRDREAGVGVPHRRAQQDLDVDRGSGCGRNRAQPASVSDSSVASRSGSAGLESCATRPYPSIHRGDVNSAIETTRQKKISASPAWAVEIAAGRKKRTVNPPNTPCAMTAPRAPTPSHLIHGRGSRRHSHSRENDGQEPDGAGNQAMAVLVEDPADPLGRRKQEHVRAVGRRPVRDCEPRAGARDQAARQHQQHRASGDELREPVKHLFRAGKAGGAGSAGRTVRSGGLSRRSSPSRLSGLVRGA